MAASKVRGGGGGGVGELPPRKPPCDVGRVDGGDDPLPVAAAAAALLAVEPDCSSMAPRRPRPKFPVPGDNTPLAVGAAVRLGVEADTTAAAAARALTPWMCEPQSPQRGPFALFATYCTVSLPPAEGIGRGEQASRR